MKNLQNLLLSICLVLGLGMEAIADTPYPETITLKQISSAAKESARLCQGHRKYDKQPTGFFVDNGKKVVVDVEIITPAADGAMPQLVVGSLGLNLDGRPTPTTYNLVAGKNTFNVNRTLGGLIYLSFTTEGKPAPVGVAKITFVEGESEHVRAPMYKYGTTTDAEFNTLLDTYTEARDVLYYSDYVLITATKERANANSRANDKDDWIDALHKLLELEDEISGLDNNDPNPVHHRLKAGEVRQLLTNNTSDSPHANSTGYTGYPAGTTVTSQYTQRYLKRIGAPLSFSSNSWLFGHEIGHQHQQPAYQIQLSTESTVNIYSIVVERWFQTNKWTTSGNNNIYGATPAAGYVRTTEATWEKVRTQGYLSLPVEDRTYWGMTDAEMNALGTEVNEVRLLPWEQLFFLFGDQFYKNLHRVVREEKMSTGGSATQERPAYLIWKSSQVSGYDLRDYWYEWGVRVTNAAVLQTMNERIDAAIEAKIVSPLSAHGRTVAELMAVTGGTIPAWAPLPLRGIAMSEPENSLLSKAGWTITTSYAGSPAAYTNVIGSDVPQAIIDDISTTAFCFVKPGRSTSGGGVTVAPPSSHIPSFTINMQTPQTFGGFAWTNYSSTAGLCATSVSLYGSNDSLTWDLLVDKAPVTTGATTTTVKLSTIATYKYVQVVIASWSSSTGITIQVAEFDLIVAPKPIYVVNFEVGADATSIAPQQVKEGNAVVEPFVLPSRSGYVFAGWFANAQYTTAWDFSSPISQNATIYVKWREVSTPGAAVYTVNFVVGEGATRVNSQQVEAGQTVTEPAHPARPGYGFAGWYADPEYSTEWAFNTPITQNVSIYVRWRVVSGYTVNFVVGEGATNVASQQVESGRTVTEPARPTRPGYSFAGWFTDPEYNTEWTFDTPITQNLTLYAKWREGENPNAVSGSRLLPLSVHPNPLVNGQLVINNEQLKAGEKVEIYTLAGTLVAVDYIAVGLQTTINLAALEKGVYLVKVGRRSAKVVK
jgi:uncharacterized repeat protein (TIGR02543 family)